MTGAERITITRDVLAQHCEVGQIRHDHQAVTLLTCPFEAGGRADGRNEERRMRLLHGPGQHRDRAEAIKRIFVDDVGLSPQSLDGGDAAPESSATLVHSALECIDRWRAER